MQKEAGKLLNISSRHVRRLLKKYDKDGDRGLISRRQGSASNHKIPEKRKSQKIRYATASQRKS